MNFDPLEFYASQYRRERYQNQYHDFDFVVDFKFVHQPKSTLPFRWESSTETKAVRRWLERNVGYTHRGDFIIRSGLVRLHQEQEAMMLYLAFCH